MVTFSTPADCSAAVARDTSRSATATTSIPAILRTWATKPRPICRHRPADPDRSTGARLAVEEAFAICHVGTPLLRAEVAGRPPYQEPARNSRT